MRTHGVARTAVVAAALLLGACGREARPAATTAPSRTPAATARALPARDMPRLVRAQMDITPVDIPARASAGEAITTTYATVPQASCDLRVRYDRDGDTHPIGPAVADENGIITWTWTPDPALAGDTAIALVVCSGGERWTSTIPID